ncbi:nuclear apoptosis-inducing factor 1 isoform X2 [Myxocyprinus asiaticus]|uniref:nuclear apoptosis-inducing factor 1 isoform X2 n=1 Tax=Myxocyprinus asiaticus TaxID=70543 RepID=UPI0022232926|nr:nuclear apoptosis-inducing factor 1 isoform X2 [Myxocyprinus asiaticus]
MSVSSLYLNQDKTVRFKRRKARFSFSEVHILLDEVRKNRHILVGKFNTGIPSDVKKRKWAEITARINEIGECDREIMEVVKKWSDLKCDTRRKVAALRSGGNLSLSQRLARSNIELSPTEVIVESILELDKKPWEASQRAPIRSYSDGQEGGGEDEEEEDGSLMGMGSVHSSPGRGMDFGGMPAATSGAVGASEMQYDGSKPGDSESNMVDSEEDNHDLLPSSSMASVSNSHSEEDRIVTRGKVGHTASNKTASSFSGVEPDSSREQLAHNASLSVQEQHATNTLLSTVSRSLEILAQSVQQLAETQQEFARESLQLQRDTVLVLREFASGALTILQEKLETDQENSQRSQTPSSTPSSTPALIPPPSVPQPRTPLQPETQQQSDAQK